MGMKPDFWNKDNEARDKAEDQAEADALAMQAAQLQNQLRNQADAAARMSRAKAGSNASGALALGGGRPAGPSGGNVITGFLGLLGLGGSNLNKKIGGGI
jgi:hypothetical protein